MPLTHLEYEQIRRALERLRGEGSNSGYGQTSIKRDDVTEILLPYVEGFKAPSPHPVPPLALEENPGSKTV